MPRSSMARKAVFLQLQGLGDQRFGGGEFGVGLAHLAGEGGDEAVH